MLAHSNNSSSATSQYLAREAEALIVQSYRLWCWGIIENQKPRLEEISCLCEQSFGEEAGQLAFDAISHLLNTLGRCVTCPLKTSPLRCQSVCSAEAILLAMLSGIQHGDEYAVAICVDEMRLGAGRDEFFTAAELAASALRSFAKPLMPVPCHTILHVISESMPNQTIH